MSRFSEKREEAAMAAGRRPPWRWLAVALIALVIAWAGYYLYHYRKLSSFAQCLSNKGAKMYGAWWCPHCADQKRELGPAFRPIPYVECSPHGLRTVSEECRQAGIRHFPTWQFGDGSRVEGVLPLPELGQKAGCAYP